MLGKREWDVIVVGAGTAGIPCAIEAAAAGARVLVVEKDAEIGGTLHLSVGQMSGAGTRRQRAKGIEDSPEAHYADVMRIGHDRADPDLVRLAVEEGARTLDWLEDLGYPTPDRMPVVYHGHEPYAIPRTVWAREMGQSILQTLRPVLDEHVAAGRVELRLGCRLRGLRTVRGRVVGIRVEEAGEEGERRGRSVVLATGGYGASAAVFEQFHPGIHCLLGARHTSTGDGIVAASAIGAATRGADRHLSSAGAIETEPGSGRWDLWEALANLAPAYRLPREIWVDGQGRRFVREDHPSADEREHGLGRVGGRAWIVFDEASISDESPLVLGWGNEYLRDEAVASGRAFAAGTIEELARRAGIDPAGLAATVAAYNAGVAAGTDALGREHLEHPVATAPFYAIPMHAGATTTFAGLAVDAELRVLDEQGRPIPGLYAAGEILGNAALMGDAFCGGMGVTPAIGFGRLLGRRLAATG